MGEHVSRPDENEALRLKRTGVASSLRLEGPPGQRLTLQGLLPNGAGYNHIDWNPEHREAIEVECRISVVSNNAPAFTKAIVLYTLEFGHGSLTIKDPGPLAPVPTQPLSWGYLVPDRGLIFRVAARQLRVNLGIWGIESGGPWNPATARAQMNVSFMPVQSVPLPDVPRTDYRTAGAFSQANRMRVFPITANEFRVRDTNGLAFPAATAQITISSQNLAGHTYDASLLADWTPIPWYAFIWQNDTNMMVQYR